MENSVEFIRIQIKSKKKGLVTFGFCLELDFTEVPSVKNCSLCEEIRCDVKVQNGMSSYTKLMCSLFCYVINLPQETVHPLDGHDRNVYLFLFVSFLFLFLLILSGIFLICLIFVGFCRH